MHAVARQISRFWLRFFLLYWICFTFPFPLDLAGLPFALVEPENQPAWMKIAGERFGEAYSWIGKRKDDACIWAGAVQCGPVS